jgi:RNA polymerase sigma-70 factor (ECF subfamily)
MQSPPSDESALISAARGGDVASYEELVRRHQGLAFRVAFLVVGQRDSAEDAVQEAFFKAYRALGRFDPARPFRPWLLSIVANEARNARKANMRRANLSTRYGEALRLDRAPGSPHEVARLNERRSKLLTALEALDEDQRLTISLRYFMELTEQEMANVLRCRPGTVKSRLNRSMARLRHVINERFPDLDVSDDV